MKIQQILGIVIIGLGVQVLDILPLGSLLDTRLVECPLPSSAIAALSLHHSSDHTVVRASCLLVALLFLAYCCITTSAWHTQQAVHKYFEMNARKG